MTSKPKPYVDTVVKARRSRLAKVHIAKKDLGLDDDTYRDLIERLFPPARSASQLSNAQLLDLIQHFKQSGWSPTTKRKTSNRADIRLIYVLWRILREGGEVKASKPDAWITEQTKSVHKPDGVKNPDWLRDDEAQNLIERMKKWIRRVGLGSELR